VWTRWHKIPSGVKLRMQPYRPIYRECSAFGAFLSLGSRPGERSPA